MGRYSSLISIAALPSAIKELTASLAAFQTPSRIQVRTVVVILAFFAAFYVFAYLAAPALPGEFEFPLGWWGWSDQGRYLRSAEAFSRLDFRGSEHYYPFFYSLLAAPFVRLMPIHPFFILDLTCFLVVVLTFLKIGSQLVGLLPSAFIFLAVICFPWVLAPLAWVVPWNSTLSAAITSVIILACNSDRFAQGNEPLWRYFVFGAFTGLLALVRPLDFVISLISFFYIAFRTFLAKNANKDPHVFSYVLVRTAALAIAASIGPFLLAAFNMKLFGSVTSPYMTLSRDSGYDLSTIPEKFVSLFNDSSSLFLVYRQTFLARFPWLTIAIAMIPSAFVIGPNILRFITILATAHVALYLAYGDLLPRSLFLYGAIHYFKLWLPYFALIGATGGLFLLQQRSASRAVYVAASGVAVALFLCSLGFQLSREPLLAAVTGPHTITIRPVNGDFVTVDFIDLPGIVSPHRLNYMCCNNEFVADGVKLRRLGDVHLFDGEKFGNRFARAYFTSSTHIWQACGKPRR